MTIHNRQQMMQGQLYPHFETQSDILCMMEYYDRARFVPPKYAPLAYSDSFIKIGKNRFLYPPLLQAQLLHNLQPAIHETVLIVGGGSGYSAAILSSLVDLVVVHEPDNRLAGICGVNMAELMIEDVWIENKNALHKGCPAHKPYHTIYIEGAVSHIPPIFSELLYDGGKIVAIAHQGNARYNMGYITTWKKNANVIEKTQQNQILSYHCLPEFN